jgi:hypothetical protein
MTGKARLFQYRGRSMWPCFQEGDLLEIAPVKVAEIRAGDCLAYRVEGERTIVHRAVATHNSLQTQGDALSTADVEPVLPEQVLGRIVRCYRLGREISVWNGKAGRVAGVFYRYAGRIDPQRSARGGRIARSIQQLSALFLSLCRYNGETRIFKRTNGQDIIIRTFGKIAVGRHDPLKNEWLISWPWKIILKSPS